MITTFLNHRNIHPTIADDLQTWDDLRIRLSVHKESPDKKLGEVWSPNIYRPRTTRGKSNVETMTLFVADLDGHSLETFSEKLDPFEYLAYTTWSHTPENPHWRVVIRLDRVMPAENWSNFWDQVSREIFENKLDLACKDESRVYWFPTHSTDSTNFETRHNIGKSLVVDEYLKKTRVRIAQDALKTSPSGIGAVTSGNDDIVEKYFAEKSKSRHSAALSAVMTLKWRWDSERELEIIRTDFIKSVTDDNSRTTAEANKEWSDMVNSARRKIEVKRNETLIENADDSSDEPRSSKRKKSVATQLVEFAEMRWRFTVGEDGRAFAIPLNGAKIAKPLSAGRGSFRSDLSNLYYLETGSVANSSALQDAITALEGKAQNYNRETTYLRSADLGDKIYIDIGTADGQAIEITENGWTKIQQAPIIFRRTELIGELPDPMHEGDIDLLRQIVNVSDSSFQLLVGWMVANYFDIPRPILFPTGTQGTGKSSFARFVVQTFDRSPAPLGSPPKDIETWQNIASGSHIVALDNISKISAELSDALCRAVTGDGMKKRQLYTDSSISVSAFKRAIIITSIDAGAIRGDLGERLLPIQLERISDTQRRSDTELNETYNRNAGQILGGVLDMISKVLAQLERIESAELPRMADFAKVLLTIDEIKGWDSFGNYLKTLESIAIDLANTDEVAVAIIDYMKRNDSRIWVGTVKELYELSNPSRLGNYSHTYPKSVSAFGQKLTEITPALDVAGIEVVRWRDRDARKVRLIKTDTVTAMTDESTFSLFKSVK